MAATRAMRDHAPASMGKSVSQTQTITRCLYHLPIESLIASLLSFRPLPPSCHHRAMASGPKTLNGKIVLQVYLLDNSYKTLLIEPTSTVHVRAVWGG